MLGAHSQEVFVVGRVPTATLKPSKLLYFLINFFHLSSYLKGFIFFSLRLVILKILVGYGLRLAFSSACKSGFQKSLVDRSRFSTPLTVGSQLEIMVLFCAFLPGLEFLKQGHELSVEGRLLIVEVFVGCPTFELEILDLLLNTRHFGVDSVQRGLVSASSLLNHNLNLLDV